MMQNKVHTIHPQKLHVFNNPPQGACSETSKYNASTHVYVTK